MAKSTGLTGTTFKVWNAVGALTEELRVPPTLREIGDHCGIASVSTVSHHLEKLEAERVIRRYPHSSRGIVLLRKPER